MEALAQGMLWFVVIAFAIAATVKLRSKMRERQMYAGDYPPFGDEVLAEDLVQPFARMENNIALRENDGNKVLRFDNELTGLTTLRTAASEFLPKEFYPELDEFRIKKLDTAKKTRASVKKKVLGKPKKAKVVAFKQTTSKRAKRKVRT